MSASVFTAQPPEVDTLHFPKADEFIDAPALPESGTGSGFQKFQPAYLRMMVGKKERPDDFWALHGLIDTGASITMIDSELAMLFMDKQDVHEKTIQIKGIGTTSSRGWITATLLIPTTSDKMVRCTTDFHLMDKLGPGVVLGTDFICGHKLNLDMGSMEVRWPSIDQSFKVQPLRPAPKLIIAESRKLPPGTCAPMRCTWSSPPPEDCLAMVDVGLWYVKGIDAAIVTPRAILDHHQPVIYVSNVGTEEILVPSNLPIAKWCSSQRSGHATDVSVQFCDAAMSTGELFTGEPDGQPFDIKENDVKIPQSCLVDGHFNVGLDDEGRPIQEIVDVLRRHEDAFTFNGKPGHVRYPPMPIVLENGKEPVAERMRRASPMRRDAIDKTIDLLEEWNVIQRSNSKASFPVHVVYQNGKPRMTIDLRGLNAITVPDRYPLQRIDDVFGALGGSQIFSTLDAAKGYHQLDIKEEDKWKTAFTCHRGLYEYNRVPFGLRNAPAWFQRFMDSFLGGLRGHGALVYMDNIVIYSKCLEDHARHIGEILKNAVDIGLRFDPKKCHFGVKSVKLLGRLISGEGISILPDRAETIRRMEVPKTVHDLHHVIGIFDYYCDSSRRHSTLMEPLRQELAKGRYVSGPKGRPYYVTKDNVRWDPRQKAIDWTERMCQVFVELKERLAS